MYTVSEWNCCNNSIAMAFITPHTCARGEVIGHVIVVVVGVIVVIIVSTKIAKSKK